MCEGRGLCPQSASQPALTTIKFENLQGLASALFAGRSDFGSAQHETLACKSVLYVAATPFIPKRQTVGTVKAAYFNHFDGYWLGYAYKYFNLN